MKNFIVIIILGVALTIFNGCQKEELTFNVPDEELQEIISPEVFVENDYLAFKNMEAVDSVVSLLSLMSENEKEVWETQMGVKSARAKFQELYGLYDKLSSEQELLSFKKEYEKDLKFEGNNPFEWSVDYPYATKYFLPVLNKDGIYKVGNSIIKYTTDDQIIILDGDIEKLNNLDKFIDNENVVYLSSKLKSNGDTRLYLDDFEDDNLDPNRYDMWSYSASGTRRLRNQLIWDTYYYNEGVNIYSGWKLLFHQKGEKKVLGIWKQYKTVYGTQDIYVQVGNFPSYWINQYVAVYTPEVYYSTIECAADHQIGTTSLFYYRPNVVFSSKTYSQGLGVWYTVDH